ncbi:MAG: hypothetical protein HC913_20715 [Microscillaceae bacterium]|nr:hypothetical protein [Microscillaceae bacterium]
MTVQLIDNRFTQVFFEGKNALLHNVYKPDSEWLEEDSFKGLMNQIQELVEQHRPHLYLVNTLDFRFVMAPAMQEWMNQHYVPRLIAAGIKKYALIVPQAFITQLSIEQTVEDAREIHQDIFKIQYLATESEARAWLLA